MKPKIIFILAVAFILFNTFVYFMTNYNYQNTASQVLNSKLNILKIHHGILQETQQKVADTAYQLTISNDKIMKILKDANSADREKQNILRKEFETLVSPLYAIFKAEGVLQYHFVLPNNIVFFRAHKVSKYGDDLTDARKDFVFVNKNKTIFRGFAQGKTAHAFRNVYPLFDKDHNHIGAIEISFSSDSVQWYLNHTSNIHSHFLVDKHIFESNAWKRDDLILQYIESAENKNLMLTLRDGHTKERCVLENSKKFIPYREELDKKFLEGKTFSLLVEARGEKGSSQVLSFLPIKNSLQDDILAWIVAYENVPLLDSAKRNTYIARSVMFLFSLLVIYFVIQQLKSKETLLKANKELDHLSKEQNILLSLFDRSDSVLFKWKNDQNWTTEYVSSSVEHLFGYDKNQFLTQSKQFAQCVFEEDLERVIEEVMTASQSGKEYFKHKPYRIYTKDNVIKWVNDNTIIIRDEDGKIIHYIGYLNDITSEKENEVLKEKQQKLIADQTKNAQMGEMIGNIAHQWRQPLSLISTSSSAIIMQKEFGIDDKEKELELLHRILNTTQYLSSTIDTFRDYIKEKKELREVVLQDRLHSAINIVKASLSNHYIEFINEIDTIEPIKITLVVGELSEVVINIINNARDALVLKQIENPFVKITLHKEDGCVVISIEDNGGGIPNEIIEKIFDPYFTTKHQSQGTGLGLYMSKEIIEKHLNGKLEVKNTQLGALFTITLPLQN